MGTVLKKLGKSKHIRKTDGIRNFGNGHIGFTKQTFCFF